MKNQYKNLENHSIEIGKNGSPGSRRTCIAEETEETEEAEEAEEAEETEETEEAEEIGIRTPSVKNNIG